MTRTTRRIGTAGACLVTAALSASLAGCRTTAGGQHEVMVVRHDGTPAPASPTTRPAESVGPITVHVDDGTTSGSGASTGVAGLVEFIGQRCTVHLRRDAAGMAGQAPMPIADERFARAASVQGVLRRATTGGVMIEIDHGQRWVPADVILAIDFPDVPAVTTRATGVR